MLDIQWMVKDNLKPISHIFILNSIHSAVKDYSWKLIIEAILTLTKIYIYIYNSLRWECYKMYLNQEFISVYDRKYLTMIKISSFVVCRFGKIKRLSD